MVKCVGDLSVTSHEHLIRLAYTQSFHSFARSLQNELSVTSRWLPHADKPIVRIPHNICMYTKLYVKVSHIHRDSCMYSIKGGLLPNKKKEKEKKHKSKTSAF